ncbi:MAG: hypothetical protein OXE42_15035 [Gammaproteobacteria bacterium]|nr:hypothetical protein [Gammaproteobacteria bacterium]
MSAATTIGKLDPEVAAEQIFTAHKHEGAWLDAFTESLDRRRSRESFARTIEVWNLSQAEAARFFGVSRQAVGKWLRHGVPPERAGAVSDLAAATDLLVLHLKRDRIPAVVRRPIQVLNGITLIDLLAQGDTRTLLATCRDMFRFERVHA